jgi:hypothetical protein
MKSTQCAGIVARGLERNGAVRLGRYADLERLFPTFHDEPGLVAAAVALLESVPRVIVARALGDLPPEVAAIALVGPQTAETRAALRAPSSESPILCDFTPDLTAAEVRAARIRGVHFVHPGGAVLLPGQRQPRQVGGATLALPLVLGRRSLGPLCEVQVSPLDEALCRAGVIALETRSPPRSGPRVVLPDAAPRVPSPVDESPATGPTSRLEASLTALAREFSHRLDRGPSAFATLEREARRILQAELTSGTLSRYALAVRPESENFAIEVLVTLPKRVGEVVVRVVAR